MVLADIIATVGYEQVAERLQHLAALTNNPILVTDWEWIQTQQPIQDFKLSTIGYSTRLDDAARRKALVCGFVDFGFDAIAERLDECIEMTRGLHKNRILRDDYYWFMDNIRR